MIKTKYTLGELFEVAAEALGWEKTAYPVTRKEVWWDSKNKDTAPFHPSKLASLKGADFIMEDIRARQKVWVISGLLADSMYGDYFEALIGEPEDCDHLFMGQHKTSWQVALLTAYASLVLGRQVELVEEVEDGD